MNKYYLGLTENSTLLNTLPQNEILKFIANGSFKIVTYEQDNVVHFDGDQCNKLEIILLGKIVVDRIDPSGNLLTIAEFYPDDILGGNLIFSKNHQYPMTVTTQLPSILLEISKDLLLDLCFSNRGFLKSYLEFISDHALLLGEKIKHSVNRSIRECVIRFLKYESKKQSTVQIKLHSSKKALAEKIGVQRTSLSRELQKMKNEGLIIFDTESITILDTYIIK